MNSFVTKKGYNVAELFSCGYINYESPKMMKKMRIGKHLASEMGMRIIICFKVTGFCMGITHFT